MAGLPGSFGKYFLCEKIAAGGMAEIYLAKLIGPGGFEKQLVVKQISPELGRQRQFVELFVAEAKTLVSLSHGNIVPVYELGVIDDTYFIAMEYVDGPPLADLLAALDARGDRLDPAVAAHVIAELCKGLDYAHRKGEGVIHRDLSPRNVLLSRDGEVKLVDFGLAVAGDLARQGQPGGGLPAGSFPYMSPEQARCEPLDPRSDLFSLGVLLWEMLTGERLFARDDLAATLAAVEAADVPPPSTLRPEVPAELDRVCARALARDRDQRFASAGDILAAVARFAYSVEPPVTQATLAALVARTCPPVARRRDGDEEDHPAREASAPRPDSRKPDAGASGGTPVRSPDDQERTRPTGQRAAARPRLESIQTFATSAQFSEALANATPLLPFPALDAETARRITERSPRRRAAGAAAAKSPPVDASASARDPDAKSDDAASRRRASSPAAAGSPPADAAASAASTDAMPRRRASTDAAGSPSTDAARVPPADAATVPPADAVSGASASPRADAAQPESSARADHASARMARAAASVDAKGATATPIATGAPAEESRGRRRGGRRGRWAVAVAALALGATALLRGGAWLDRDGPMPDEPGSVRSATSSASAGATSAIEAGVTETGAIQTGATETATGATEAAAPNGAAPSTAPRTSGATGSATSSGATAPRTSGATGSATSTAAPGSAASTGPGDSGSGPPPTSSARGTAPPSDGSETSGSAATAGSDRPPPAGSSPGSSSGSAPVDGSSDRSGGDKGRKARGRGTLQVGANPWADVYVDGALVGQAPGAWQVDAGPHAVELRHRDARRRFRVSIEPGATESLGMVDFAAP